MGGFHSDHIHNGLEVVVTIWIMFRWHKWFRIVDVMKLVDSIVYLLFLVSIIMDNIVIFVSVVYFLRPSFWMRMK